MEEEPKEEPKQEPGQEPASGLEGQKPPEPPPVIDHAKELEVARGELKALQEALKKQEHDYASLKGTVAQRYDQLKENSAIRREMRELRTDITELVEAQATGEPERIATVKASWASRAQQAETASLVEQEAVALHQDIISEAEEMGIKINPNAPAPEEFGDVVTLWNEGFNVDPSKLRLGPMRQALRLAKEKRRAFQKRQDAEREAQMQKEVTEQVRKAKKDAGILETPVASAAGKSMENLEDIEEIRKLDLRGKSPEELAKIKAQLRKVTAKFYK